MSNAYRTKTTGEPLELLSSFSAAEYLDIPHSSLVRMAKQGLVPCYWLPMDELRFDRDELQSWVRSHRHPQREATS